MIAVDNNAKILNLIEYFSIQYHFNLAIIKGAFAVKQLSVAPIKLSLESIPDPFSQLIASSESEQGGSGGCRE